MNYFFFLDTEDKDLSSSVEIFNRPPAKRLSTDTLTPKNVIAFYSDNNQWHSHCVTKLNPNSSINLKKTDLPNNFLNKSVFLCLSDNENVKKFSLNNEDYMNCIPSWRANIKISSNTSSVSYQGEYPFVMTQKKLSLVSCSPMIQYGMNISSYFYLINLKSEPKQSQFSVKILDTNKNIIQSVIFKTNCINILNLKDILKDNKNLMYVFSSEEEGGIPIYFSKNIYNNSFSLEHTHPPTEYTFQGNRNIFQNKKKSFWHI